jgi:hypothetical protein
VDICSRLLSEEGGGPIEKGQDTKYAISVIQFTIVASHIAAMLTP